MNRERLKWVISGLDFERLNEWESNFCEQVELRYDLRQARTGRGYVTEGEEEVLERLYREKGR